MNNSIENALIQLRESNRAVFRSLKGTRGNARKKIINQYDEDFANSLSTIAVENGVERDVVVMTYLKLGLK